MTRETKQPVTILFIGGFGRSGSTLLERLYGQIPGFCALGEVRHVWRRGFIENQLSGCGNPFRASPFWKEVIARAFGGFDDAPVEEALFLKRRLDRTRHIPYLAWPQWRSKEFQADLGRFGDILARLYGSVAAVSGAEVLVDSSKHPCYGFLLAATGQFDLRLLHMVRDSRACAYSWQRVKLRPEIQGRQESMPRIGTVASAIQWRAANRLMKWLGRQDPEHYHVLRYEDLVNDPASRLKDSLRKLGLAEADLPFIQGNRATLGMAPTVAGNPFRFKQGEVQVRLDDEWESRMPIGSRRLVTALTWLMLREYGYR